MTTSTAPCTTCTAGRRGVRRPGGNKTKTSYTPATGGPVTGMKVDRPAGLTTTSTVDPALGPGHRHRRRQQQRTDLQYDALGRPDQVWMPGRAKATDTPNLEYAYLIRNDGPAS